MDQPSEGTKLVPPDMRRTIFDDLVRYPSRDQPYWIQVMGIPGAGKSTLVGMLAEKLSFRKPYTLAATDVFLEQLPAYRALPDRDEAFRLYDPVVTALGYEVFTQLIAQKSDVLFERSLADILYRDLMYIVKKSGYRLVTVLIRVDVAVAKARTEARALETNRHVPEAVIDERAILIEERWKDMLGIADYTVEVKNNGEVSAPDALRGTVEMVTEYIRGMGRG